MNEPLSASEAHDDLAWLRPLLQGVFVTEDVTSGLMAGQALRLRGQLLISADEAYRRLAPSFARRQRTLLMRRQQDQDVLISLDWVNQPKPNSVWIPAVLGVLTVFSILASYMLNFAMTEYTWQSAVSNLGQGLQFTVALVVILLTHELAHYFMARRFGVAVSLPHLIPLPLSPFGTMGALIRMKDIPPNRRAMLLTGAAGPLAGLAVSLPILIAGLMFSEILPLPESGTYLLEGNSILYASLKYLIHGAWLPSATHDIAMHPLAFAGWAGLLVTGFNLIPAGQLDGGHVAYAWLGDRARYLTYAILGALLLLGIIWPGWIVWAVLVFFLARHQQEPLENISGLSPRETAIAVLVLVLFILTFTPMPLRYIN